MKHLYLCLVELVASYALFFLFLELYVIFGLVSELPISYKNIQTVLPWKANHIMLFTGWQSLLVFVKNSVLTSSKEVSLAAINCLQTTVLAHSAKVVCYDGFLCSLIYIYTYVLISEEWFTWFLPFLRFDCVDQGNLPMPYLESILDVYKHILVKSPNYTSSAAAKVKQEILHGLGISSLLSPVTFGIFSLFFYRSRTLDQVLC